MLTTVTVSLYPDELPQLTALLRSLDTARDLAASLVAPRPSVPPLQLVTTQKATVEQVAATAPGEILAKQADLPEKVDITKVREVVTALAQSVNMKAAVDLLEQYGAKRTSDLPAEKYEEFYLAATSKILVAKGA